MTAPAEPTPHQPGNSVGLAWRLAEVTEAREAWLAETTRALRADRRVAGSVLVGSLAAGSGDPFSDVDLIVALDPPIPPSLLADPFGGLGLPGVELYRRPKPRNAPTAGAYLAVAVELAALPVLIDVYVWPATTAAVPAGARVLTERAQLSRSELGLLDLLATCPPDDPTGSDPDDPATVLLLVQLAAKYHARGDQDRWTAICRQLHIADITTVGDLHRLLDTRLSAHHPPPPAAVAAVRRLLDLASVTPSPPKMRCSCRPAITFTTQSWPGSGWSASSPPRDGSTSPP